ncbi:MAG: universal stress protein [Candidatus Solibacter sp.]
MEIRSILVPFDFSEASEHAVRYASGLATGFGAKITILHVLPPLRYEYAMVQPNEQRLREINQHRTANALQVLGNVLPEDAAPGLRCEVLEGEPAEIITQAANEGRYDAVVMSTRGSGAFKRWLVIGSVTSKVLHGCERPVITSVHFEDHDATSSMGRILCAVDLGPQTMNVVCWGMRAARKFGAQLEVVHVAAEEPPEFGGEDLDAWKDRTSDRAMARIDEVKRALDAQAETTIGFGHPARVLSSIAQRRNADLLVLGRGVSQDVLGRLRANAYDIIRQCPCPVVSI